MQHIKFVFALLLLAAGCSGTGSGVTERSYSGSAFEVGNLGDFSGDAGAAGEGQK